MSESRKRGFQVITEKGFTLYQQNGQRTYGGPPPNWGRKPAPSRECEVFIGRLPRTCYEDELIPLFLSVGELYEFRLMLDFSGTNRGYGYAHYATIDDAKRAIERLNKFEIRPGHYIGVLKSKNNCRLLFGNISCSTDVNTFSDFITSNTQEVLNIFMFRSFQELKHTEFRISPEVEEAFLARMPRNNVNNLFAIVEYENHKAAAVARRVLIPKYGHILAIDWAVPPRERKRFCTGSEMQVQPVERPLSNTVTRDPNPNLVTKPNAKIRPVPLLLVEPSTMDNVTFMPKTFNTIVKFFKYQLSVCLYKSVDQLEIPLFICKEIERKIVDRITNLENCSQAVLLIFNYFSWYNEKKHLVINSEVRHLLQEVKFYADSFVLFVNKRLTQGPSQNPAEDNYYIHVLPLRLSILFRIILRSDAECQAKLSSGITKGLNWMADVVNKGGKASREFMEEIINLVKNEDGTSLDKASALAKSLFLNTITSHQQSQNVLSNTAVDLPITKNTLTNNRSAAQAALGVESISRVDAGVLCPPFVTPSDLNFQHMKGGPGHYLPIPFSQICKFNEETTLNSGGCPAVPLLVVQPSIMNKVPFMPDIFNNVLTYFKYFIRDCLKVLICQMDIPQSISGEIERKIIDRISNMENCAEGVQLILNYLSWWISKEPECHIKVEVLQFLREVKNYADSFVNFVWNKTTSVYIPNEASEEYFCKALPLKLNLLFHMMLIFNREIPNSSLVGISKGLNWMEEIIQKGDSTAKQFLEELTRYVVEQDVSAYERARTLVKAFCLELASNGGQGCIPQGAFFSFLADDRNTDRTPKSSSITESIPSMLSLTGSDNASEGTLDYDC